MTETLNNLGKRIDAATDAADESALKLIVDECDSRLEIASGADRVLLYYFQANAYHGISLTKHDDDYAWSWRQIECVAELLSLRRAIAEPAFDTFDVVRRCQIRTNLANRLNSLGRCVEALEQWQLVLQASPHFAMALGNMARGICCYAEYLYDSGHVGIFLNAASKQYSAALGEDGLWDSGPDKRAHDAFSHGLARVNAYLEAIKFDHSFDLNAFALGETVEEQRYRRWCLQERLFLNPLNDVTTAHVAAIDALHLPSHVYRVGESPRFSAYYNHLKQEYISARFQTYQYQAFDFLRGHFTDREVLILDNADGGEFGHHVDQLKTAFRSAYALFDKIALFLNDYFSVGMKPRQVTFRKIWGNPQLHTVFDGNQNWPLRGLYYLSQDLFDEELSSVATPDARELASLRNHLEHRFITLQHYDAGLANSDTHLYITADRFFGKTIRIMRMARAALTYLSLAMYREETIRSKNTKTPTAIPTLRSVPIMRPWD